MTIYALGDFTHLFLKTQNLEDFYLGFEPKRRGARRAKRRTALIEAQIPTPETVLKDRKTVADLIERFHLLAPETRDWLEGATSYVIRLYDTQGEIVPHSELLRDVRRRDEERREAGLSKARKVISRALNTCDQLDLESKDIKELVRQILEEHYTN